MLYFKRLYIVLSVEISHQVAGKYFNSNSLQSYSRELITLKGIKNKKAGKLVPTNLYLLYIKQSDIAKNFRVKFTVSIHKKRAL